MTLGRRDTGEKLSVKMDGLVDAVKRELEEMQERLLRKARKLVEERTVRANSMEELKSAINEGKWVIAEYCGNAECEDVIKESSGAEPRVVPFGSRAEGKCVVCGKDAKQVVYWARAY